MPQRWQRLIILGWLLYGLGALWYQVGQHIGTSHRIDHAAAR